MMVPARRGRSDVTESVPMRRIRTSEEIDARQGHASGQIESLGRDLAQHLDSGRLRELAHRRRARVRSRASLATVSVARHDNSHSRGLKAEASLSDRSSGSGSGNQSTTSNGKRRTPRIPRNPYGPTSGTHCRRIPQRSATLGTAVSRPSYESFQTPGARRC